MELEITYIGHSGFCITVDEYFLMFDYFEGDVPVDRIKDSKKSIIFVSHAHPDHFSQKIFTADKYCDDVTYVLSDDIQLSRKAKEKKIKSLSFDEEINIGRINVKTFDSSDEGICYLLEYKDTKIFHAGDLNLWCWRNNNTKEEIEKAEADYYRILNSIIRVTDSIDIVFFPLDARMKGYYYEGAVRFLEAFKIRHFFPMHMWNRYRNVKVLKDYNSIETTIHSVSNSNKKFLIRIGD